MLAVSFMAPAVSLAAPNTFTPVGQSWINVECIINTRSLSQENAKSLAKDMCSETFGRLASPKSYVLTIRENSSHVQIWYKVILSNQ